MLNKLKSYKLQTQMTLLCAPFLLLGVLITGWSLISINVFDRALDNLLLYARHASDVAQAENDLIAMELAMMNYMATLHPNYLEEADRYRMSIDAYLEQTAIYEQLWLDFYGEDMGVLQHVTSAQDALARYDEQWAAPEEMEQDAAIESGLAAIDASGEAYNSLDEIYNIAVDEQNNSQAQVNNQLTVFSIGSILGLVIFISIIVITTLAIDRQIATPLLDLVDAANAFARDELHLDDVKKHVERTDEIGYLSRGFLKMVEAVQADEQALRDEAEAIRLKLANLQAD